MKMHAQYFGLFLLWFIGCGTDPEYFAVSILLAPLVFGMWWIWKNIDNWQRDDDIDIM